MDRPRTLNHFLFAGGKVKTWLQINFRMITKPDFEKFLKEIQFEDFSNAKIDEIIADCIQHDDDQAAGEKTQAAWASGSFGIYGFAHYINNYTNIFDEKLTDQVGEYPGQSMDEPITSYWIASSHNTYLEKDQLGKVENKIFIWIKLNSRHYLWFKWGLIVEWN